jgi:hypothetical protein
VLIMTLEILSVTKSTEKMSDARRDRSPSGKRRPKPRSHRMFEVAEATFLLRRGQVAAIRALGRGTIAIVY